MRFPAIIFVASLLAFSTGTFALGGSTCAQATVVGALPYSDGGQLESGFDPNCPGEPTNDRFYVFTAPYASTFRFDMCGSGDCCIHLMRLWTDGTCCSGASVTVSDGCGDGAPQYDLAMSQGQVVYIEVGKAGAEWAVAPTYQFHVADVSPPAGGTCATATVVGALPYTHGGQLESGFDLNCAGAPSNDRFYVFTAPQTGTFRFDMCGSGDCCIHAMRLWTDGTCCSGASVTVSDGCGDGAPRYDLAMTSGQVVYIEVGKVGFEWAIAPTYIISISQSNDVCPGIEIPSLPYSDSGTTQTATHQYAGYCYYGLAPDVVYNFTFPDCVYVRAVAVASWIEALQVRSGNCASGALSACEAGNSLDSSWIGFWAAPDTYYFIVDGRYDWEAGPYTFSLSEVTPPHDECPGREIPALPYTDNGSMQYARHQYDNHCHSEDLSDVVYHFTSPDSLVVRATLSLPIGQRSLQVRKNHCENGTTLQCASSYYGSSVGLMFWTEPDSTYFIIAAGYPFDQGYTFTLQESPGDLCPGKVIPSLPFVESGSTANATHQYSGDCYLGQSASDVVYRYSSSDSVVLVASMVAPWSDCMQVRRNDCAYGVSFYCDIGTGPDSSWFVFLAEPDSTYYFIVDGANWESGSYTFSLQETTPSPSDLCPGTVIPDLPYSDSGTTLTATHQYSGNCFGGYSPDIVYSYTSPESVYVRSVVLAAWDEALQVRKNNCASGASLRCDFGSGPDSSWFAFWAEPDSTYYFIVDGNDVTESGYTFTLQESQNDICPGTVIPALPYTDNNSTAFATHQYGGSCYDGTSPDMVYMYSSPGAILIRATVHAPWANALQVRKNVCASGASLHCDLGYSTDSSQILLLTEPDSTYFFIVDGEYDVEYGLYSFTLQEYPLLANDFCPGVMIPALPFIDSGSTALATHQYEGSCYSGTAPDVVYHFTSNDSVLVLATVQAAWWEAMHVRRNDCASGESVLCDFGSVHGITSLEFWAEPDSTYYFIVDGRSDVHFGEYLFSLRSPSCPVPDSLVISIAGTDAVLSWRAVECDWPTYTIFRSSSPDVQAIPENEVAAISDTTYTDVGIITNPGDKFFYVVTATN